MREWSSLIGSLGTGLEWHRIEIFARSTLSLIHVAAAVFCVYRESRQRLVDQQGGGLVA